MEIPVGQRERMQMVLLGESGMAQPAIAEVVGVSLNTVNRADIATTGGGAHMALSRGRDQALKPLKPKPIGGHHQGQNMTPCGEKALLVRFAQAAGEMLNIHDLKAA